MCLLRTPVIIFHDTCGVYSMIQLSYARQNWKHTKGEVCEEKEHIRVLRNQHWLTFIYVCYEFTTNPLTILLVGCCCWIGENFIFLQLFKSIIPHYYDQGELMWIKEVQSGLKSSIGTNSILVARWRALREFVYQTYLCFKFSLILSSSIRF